MASQNLLRKLVSASSCLPVRTSHLLRSNAGKRMTVARSEVKARYMSSAVQDPAAQDANSSSSDYKESQLQRRDDGALSDERNFPPRVFDLMDSFFPARNLRSMIETMDRLFDDPPSFLTPSLRESPLRRALRTPMDFQETEDAFKLRLDIPGFSKDEVKVYVEEDCLVIKGEHKPENKTEEEKASRGYGSYLSRILLPDNANMEEIKAELKDGVLKVTVPKLKEEEHKTNVIEVPIA